MHLLVIDGQGGGIGSKLIAELLPALPVACTLVGVGTNVFATNTMLKAGAHMGATGENAIIYNASKADIILGPMGIILANAMLGEITPAMSVAVSGSEAVKILVPSAKCSVYVAGVESCSLENHIKSAIKQTICEIQRHNPLR